MTMNLKKQSRAFVIMTTLMALLTAPLPTGGLIPDVLEELESPCGVTQQLATQQDPTAACLWDTTYRGPGMTEDQGKAVATNPDGSRVFVAGDSWAAMSFVAYDTTDGSELWRTQVERENGRSHIGVGDIAVSPNGNSVYATGWYRPATAEGREGLHMLTLGFNALTGDELWRTSHHPGGDFGGSCGAEVVVGPDGLSIFVAGTTAGYDGYCGRYQDHMVTAAFDALTGVKLWVTDHDGGLSNRWGDRVHDLGASSDGMTIFVTGTVATTTGFDPLTVMRTIAIDAITGIERWSVDREPPASDQSTEARGLAVAPDGSHVYVTGVRKAFNEFNQPRGHFVTTAYDAKDGSVAWDVEHTGPAPNQQDQPTGIGVSPDGSTVFVAGTVYDSDTGYDFTAIAYDAAGGSQLWAIQYDDAATDNTYDSARGMGVSPDGYAVIVTGVSQDGSTFFDPFSYATVAFNATNGDQLWETHYSGPANDDDMPLALATSRDGSRIFVTGQSYSLLGNALDEDFATLAYDAATGTEEWVARHDANGRGHDEAAASEVSPDGRLVFVTGSSMGHGTGLDYATIAHDTTTGAVVWSARYDGPAASWDRPDEDLPVALAVSPDGGKVFVTGSSAQDVNFFGEPSNFDYATVAYDASTGDELWVTRYDGPLSFDDHPVDMVISPDGSTVFVTGESFGTDLKEDYVTLAYNAATGSELWVARYDGPAGDKDVPAGLEVNPDGSTVYVTGTIIDDTTTGSAQDPTEILTIAYDANTGAQVWMTQTGLSSLGDQAQVLAISPDGSELFIGGSTQWGLMGWQFEWLTVGLDATNGGELWTATRRVSTSHQYPAGGPAAIGVTPDGSRVFVAGSGSAITAYDASSGIDLWSIGDIYTGGTCGGNHQLDVCRRALAVSPDGRVVMTAGPGFTTQARDTSSGDKVWVSNYDGPEGTDMATTMATSHADSRIFVAGATESSGFFDLAIAAYNLEPLNTELI